MTKTEKVIEEMLKERTGAHALDSGGIYGRHWERNQNRDFRNEPSVFVGEDIWPTINLYHWLVSKVEFDEEMDKRFHEWVKDKPKEWPWLKCMEEFAEYLRSRGEITRPWGTTNTYNYESLLSQVIQYVRFQHENGEEYVLLQIHNGCDVRGGYTKPRAFRVMEEDGLLNEDLILYCESEKPHVFRIYGGRMIECPVSEEIVPIREIELLEGEGETGTINTWHASNGKLFCPFCGAEMKGELA